jgi:hypothetical protein
MQPLARRQPNASRLDTASPSRADTKLGTAKSGARRQSGVTRQFSTALIPPAFGQPCDTVADSDCKVNGLDEMSLKTVAKQVRPGTIVDAGPGYFKIARRHNLEPGLEAAAGTNHHYTDSALVVAFGSAPGVPNWGGMLKRVELAGAADSHWQSFDVLFVVDGARSWYNGACLLESPLCDGIT